jgi:hypothetical protein
MNALPDERAGRPRARGLEALIRVFAVIGALTVLTSAIGIVSSWHAHSRPPFARGTVTYANGQPAAQVPVFLDRGAVIERYTTDSVGRYRLPLARAGRGEAWLICPRNALPSVGYVGQYGGSNMTLTLNTRDLPLGARMAVRGFGWSAPIPRECIHADSTTYWRGPVDSVGGAVSVELREPDWSTYQPRC